MRQETELQQLFKQLAAALPREAGPQTQERLLAAFRNRKQRGPQRWIYWGSAAASLVLVSAWFFAHHATPAYHLNPTENGTDFRATAGFIPLPYGQSDVPLEQAVVVRVNLRPPDWEALGIPGAPYRRGNTISADLLIGQDGVARAVRLVNVP